MKIKVGQGFDVHGFEDGDHVTIGGVKIPHTKSLRGHSDADVVLHALVDAILGALGRGDIGQHFSPKDDRWRDADSSLFVRQAVEWLNSDGYTLQNADITLICEAPRLGVYRQKIRDRVASLLKIDVQDVNIKATTTEKLGFTGREEGIAAQAVVCITKLK